MKTYKINGKEIKGFNISKDILGEFAPEHKIDELLEALSDKEEDYSYLDNLEQISHCCKAKIFFKGAGKGLWCSSCKKEVFHTEYVEELKQEELVERDPIMRNRHIICPVKPKQSTSLKEDWDNLDVPYLTTIEKDKVLKLIQSHLLKEIELERIKNDYIELRQDEIIKIINNL